MAEEFGRDRIDGGAMGSQTVDELRDPEVFRAWVDMLLDHERGSRVPEELVASTTRWVAVDGRLVGFLSVRHQLNDYLLEARRPHRLRDPAARARPGVCDGRHRARTGGVPPPGHRPGPHHLRRHQRRVRHGHRAQRRGPRGPPRRQAPLLGRPALSASGERRPRPAAPPRRVVALGGPEPRALIGRAGPRPARGCPGTGASRWVVPAAGPRSRVDNPGGGRAIGHDPGHGVRPSSVAGPR